MKFSFEKTPGGRIENNPPVTYHLESGLDAELSYKVFESSESKPDEAVIFLPGLKMNPDDANMKNLGESYAKSSKRNTYVIKSELKSNLQDKSEMKETLFFEEALAIKKFIKEKNLKNIIIAGYSMGGTKGIDLAYVLQDESDVSVQGLVLLSSPGLYEQKKDSLKKNLIRDSLVTPGVVLSDARRYPNAFGRGVDGAKSFAKIIFKDLSGKNNIKRDFSEMERYSSHVEDLNVPVIIIQGSKDMVVEADKIAPPDIQPADREEYLKNNIFKKAPYVKMVVAENLGKHGLPVFRSESVAEASIGLLNRFNKKD